MTPPGTNLPTCLSAASTVVILRPSLPLGQALPRLHNPALVNATWRFACAGRAGVDPASVKRDGTGEADAVDDLRRIMAVRETIGAGLGLGRGSGDGSVSLGALVRAEVDAASVERDGAREADVVDDCRRTVAVLGAAGVGLGLGGGEGDSSVGLHALVRSSCCETVRQAHFRGQFETSVGSNRLR